MPFSQQDRPCRSATRQEKTLLLALSPYEAPFPVQALATPFFNISWCRSGSNVESSPRPSRGTEIVPGRGTPGSRRLASTHPGSALLLTSARRSLRGLKEPPGQVQPASRGPRTRTTEERHPKAGPTCRCVSGAALGVTLTSIWSVWGLFSWDKSLPSESHLPPAFPMLLCYVLLPPGRWNQSPASPSHRELAAVPRKPDASTQHPAVHSGASSLLRHHEAWPAPRPAPSWTRRVCSRPVATTPSTPQSCTFTVFTALPSLPSPARPQPPNPAQSPGRSKGRGHAHEARRDGRGRRRQGIQGNDGVFIKCTWGGQRDSLWVCRGPIRGVKRGNAEAPSPGQGGPRHGGSVRALQGAGWSPDPSISAQLPRPWPQPPRAPATRKACDEGPAWTVFPAPGSEPGT